VRARRCAQTALLESARERAARQHMPFAISSIGARKPVLRCRHEAVSPPSLAEVEGGY